MALKTLELRARRDAFVVFFLGFFMILTHFLYSQSLPVAVAMLVSVLGPADRAGARPHAGRPAEPAPGRRAWRRARPLLGAPMMALLFVLFPRIGPLWGVPQDGISTTGLSNSMRWARSPRSRRTNRVAMRMRFDGRRRRPAQMYFRGPVLSRFDGIEWRPLGLPFAPRRRCPRGCRRCSRAASRCATRSRSSRCAGRSLPLLDATTEVAADRRLRLSAAREDLHWLADRPIFERLRFKAEAYPRFRHGPRGAPASCRSASSCRPASTRAPLAWARGAARATGRTARPTRRLRRRGAAPHPRRRLQLHAGARRLRPATPIDEFWLDRKAGFCEHFAASFVVIMRAIGVPARIVTGYQGADADAGRRLLHRPAELGARLGRVLADRPGLGPRRPDRRRRARPHRQQHAGCRRSRAWSPARSAA